MDVLEQRATVLWVPNFEALGMVEELKNLAVERVVVLEPVVELEPAVQESILDDVLALLRSVLGTSLRFYLE